MTCDHIHPLNSMPVLILARAWISCLLISILIGFVCVSDQALATSCQVYPLEYAYHYDSVNTIEWASANCRRYPAGALPEGSNKAEYIHCDGTQLKLADSNLGQEQYTSIDYYQWSAGREQQLLLIFPARVSLTTITLHYYSDSYQGLPRLRFYAVPDDLDIWDPPTIGIPHVDVNAVPPGGESAGPRNVSINVNFNTMKVFMYKYSSSFQFALSEVEFFTYDATTTTTTEIIAATSLQGILPTTSAATTSVMEHHSYTILANTGSLESFENEPHGTHSTLSDNKIKPRETVAWVLVATLAVLLLLSLAIHVIQAIYAHRRSNKNPSPECALAMDSNPCYEASNVKQTEAQDVHVYEMVQQNK